LRFSAKPGGNREPIARVAVLSFKLSISRSTVLAIVNDAFGAASRRAMLGMRLAGVEKRPLYDEQRNDGGATFSPGPNLDPGVSTELLHATLSDANRPLWVLSAKRVASVVKGT
jgi:hypothetical protein